MLTFEAASMTIADQILSSPVVKDGGWFTAQQLAKHLGCSQSAVKFELRQAAEREALECKQECPNMPTYYRLRKAGCQFIYTRPLADTSWMESGV